MLLQRILKVSLPNNQSSHTNEAVKLRNFMQSLTNSILINWICFVILTTRVLSFQFNFIYLVNRIKVVEIQLVRHFCAQ